MHKPRLRPILLDCCPYPGLPQSPDGERREDTLEVDRSTRPSCALVNAPDPSGSAVQRNAEQSKLFAGRSKDSRPDNEMKSPQWISRPVGKCSLKRLRLVAASSSVAASPSRSCYLRSRPGRVFAQSWSQVRPSRDYYFGNKARQRSKTRKTNKEKKKRKPAQLGRWAILGGSGSGGSRPLKRDGDAVENQGLEESKETGSLSVGRVKSSFTTARCANLISIK